MGDDTVTVGERASGLLDEQPDGGEVVGRHAHDGVIVSVVSAPALGRRWWAATGRGTFADGRACVVSNVSSIADAQISITFSDGWEHWRPDPRWQVPPLPDDWDRTPAATPS